MENEKSKEEEKGATQPLGEKCLPGEVWDADQKKCVADIGPNEVDN